MIFIIIMMIVFNAISIFYSLPADQHSGPLRRNVGVKGTVEGGNGGEEEILLSQGDMLNRRKMALKQNVKQNVLVEVVKRSSSPRKRPNLMPSYPGQFIRRRMRLKRPVAKHCHWW